MRVRKVLMRLLLTTAAIILAAAFSVAGQDLAQLDAAVEAEMKATGTPGAAVAVVRGDRLVYAKGFGSTSVEGGSPVTPDTLFRIGSTTKMFTAAAFGVLAERGKARHDERVSAYVPGLTPKLGSLTAHQLLSQSSGLRDMDTAVRSDDDAALALNVAAWRDDAFFTEPDTIYSYSSANFWLAGHIVERLHGKPYADAMAELLFEPLGMDRSFLRPREAMTYPLALGHNRQGTAHSVNRPAANNAAIYPGGSIFSSVNDLSRWAVAMMNGGKLDGKQAIPERVAAELMRPQFHLPGAERAFYGYGMLGYEDRGVKTVGHGGVSRGYGAFIFFAPEQKVAIIVLTNSNGQTMPLSREKAMQLFLPLRPAPPAAAATVRPVELERYAGRYVHAPQAWEFAVRDGKLLVKAGGKESELKPTGKDEFGSDQGQFLFVANAKGEFEHVFMGLYAARRTK